MSTNHSVQCGDGASALSMLVLPDIQFDAGAEQRPKNSVVFDDRLNTEVDSGEHCQFSNYWMTARYSNPN
jgi:hypothetical protein